MSTTSGSCGDDATWQLIENNKLLFVGTGSMYVLDTDGIDCPYAWAAFKSDVITVEIGSGITNISDYAFSKFTKLSSVTVPTTITEIGEYAFYRCDMLRDIVLPDGLITIGEYAFAFSDMTPQLPATLTYIGEYAFGCSTGGSNLVLTIPRGVQSIPSCVFVGTYVTKIIIHSDVYFFGDYSLDTFDLATIEFSGYVSPNYESPVFGYIDPLSITVIVPSNYQSEKFCGVSTKLEMTGDPVTDPVWKHENVTYSLDLETGCLTVSGFGMMTYWDGDDTWSSDPLIVTEYPWGVCGPALREKIKSVVIEDGIKSIDGAFVRCSIETLVIGRSVEAIYSYAFIWCSLTDLVIPDSVRYIGTKAFWANNLKTIEIGTNVDKVLDSIFGQNPDIETIIFHGVRSPYKDYRYSLGTTVVVDVPELYEDTTFCGVSVSPTLPDTVFNGSCDYDITYTYDAGHDSLVISGDYMRRETTNWDEYSSDVNNYEKVPWYRFSNTAIHVTIEEGVTEICSWAFDGFVWMQSITIPASVTQIHGKAFTYCSALTQVRYFGTSDPYNTELNDGDMFSGSVNSGLKIEVPPEYQGSSFGKKSVEKTLDVNADLDDNIENDAADVDAQNEDASKDKFNATTVIALVVVGMIVDVIVVLGVIVCAKKNIVCFKIDHSARIGNNQAP